MKPWQLTYEVEQTGFDLPDGPRHRAKHSIAPCNALAPDHVTVCGFVFQGATSFCQRVKDHPGGHSTKPSTCNRPLNHEGPHAFVVWRDARRLGEWE